MKAKKPNKFILLSILCIIFSLLVYVFMPSKAADDIPLYKVEQNSELIYYIDVYYDGKDKNGVATSNGATADVYSDHIYVEDKLPEGLTFSGFVTTSDNTFGAVQSTDSSQSCSAGYVVGCPDGFKEDGSGTTCLKYDATTRIVSFTVKSLQAGCKLTVGVKTMTPTLENNTRLDFYNTAYGREGMFSAKSNTVHAFMGDLDETLYTVSYSYTGDVPDNAPELPTTTSHSAGASVGVEKNMSLEGYEFSGWESSSVTISNGTFTMPQANVIFEGSFEPKVRYTVTYDISGDNVPEGYILPKTKNYGIGDDVYVDSLSAGDVINGYRFLGWQTTNATVTDGSFQMPEANVKLVGTFEQITYTVSYAFQGSVLPPNANDILAEINANSKYAGPFAPGDTVTVANNPSASNYKFLGWYSESTFEMPEADVVIYGEWMVSAGTFSPSISMELIDGTTHYSSGDTVNFAITVTNNSADFEITDVMLQEMTEGAKFITSPDNNYTVSNDIYVTIPTIAAAKNVTVYAQYVLPEVTDIVKTYKNKVELTGAIGGSGYQLDTSVDYTASVNFKVTNISLVIDNVFINDSGNSQQLTGTEFSLYTDSNLENVVTQDESFDGITFKKLNSDTTYYLKQTKVVAGYVLIGDKFKVEVASDGTITIEAISVDGKTSTVEVANNNGVATATIINEKINILPNTGGVGIIPFVLIGLIMILGGSVVFVYYIMKKGRGNRNEKK